MYLILLVKDDKEIPFGCICTVPSVSCLQGVSQENDYCKVIARHINYMGESSEIRVYWNGQWFVNDSDPIYPVARDSDTICPNGLIDKDA